MSGVGGSWLELGWILGNDGVLLGREDYLVFGMLRGRWWGGCSGIYK